MLLENTVGHLLVALAARAEALDVAICSEAALQQLHGATASHAPVLHLLPCKHTPQHTQLSVNTLADG
jgi:hypothetical protein